jgi:hypothetical protein
MARAGDSIGLAVLGRPWRRWTAVVEGYARRRGWSVVGPAAYDALYHDLIASCRAVADSDDAATREYGRRLEALVRPWLSTSVLERSDREILVDLSARCRRIDRELNGRRWGDLVPARARPALAGLAGAALIALVACAVYGMYQPINGWLDGRWRAVRVAYLEATTIQCIAVAGAIMIPLMLFLAYRVRKV